MGAINELKKIKQKYVQTKRSEVSHLALKEFIPFKGRFYTPLICFMKNKKLMYTMFSSIRRASPPSAPARLVPAVLFNGSGLLGVATSF